MQKKLIALAVASVFAAPAFAATSNVDVYGSINVSLDNIDNGAVRSNSMVTNNNSFLGVKGSEDLGGGLSAVWQLETNVSFDGNGKSVAAGKNLGTGGSNLFGTRNTYVGLSSKSIGTVVAGVHDTPYKMATGKLDLFVGTIGDYNTIFGSAGGGCGNSSCFDLRTGNTIAYLSPNFGGFDVKAAYVMGEGNKVPATPNRSSAYSLSGTYANGPLFVTAAYEKHTNVNADSNCNTGATCLTTGTGTNDDHAWKIGAGFNVGDLGLGAAYEKIGGDSFKRTAWMANASYKLGSIKLKAQYTTAGKVNSAADTGADQWAVGADYSMSKRTTIQATYAKLNNDAAGTWVLGQGATYKQSTTGADVDGFSIGIKHTF